jgi:hypothetical protein
VIPSEVTITRKEYSSSPSEEATSQTFRKITDCPSSDLPGVKVSMRSRPVTLLAVAVAVAAVMSSFR